MDCTCVISVMFCKKLKKKKKKKEFRGKNVKKENVSN